MAKPEVRAYYVHKKSISAIPTKAIQLSIRHTTAPQGTPQAERAVLTHNNMDLAQNGQKRGRVQAKTTAKPQGRANDAHTIHSISVHTESIQQALPQMIEPHAQTQEYR